MAILRHFLQKSSFRFSIFVRKWVIKSIAIVVLIAMIWWWIKN